MADYSKIFERKKIAGTVLFASWMVIEHCNSVGAGAHKIGRASFWPNFDACFS